MHSNTAVIQCQFIIGTLQGDTDTDLLHECTEMNCRLLRCTVEL